MNPLRAASRLLDTALDRAVVPGFSSVGYAVRTRLPTWPADPAPNALAGKHIAVTGATSGLGEATARQVSELGGHVHLLVRNEAKATKVAASLPSASTTWTCDLADLDSVRTVAAEIADAGITLDGVVHNGFPDAAAN